MKILDDALLHSYNYQGMMQKVKQWYELTTSWGKMSFPNIGTKVKYLNQCTIDVFICWYFDIMQCHLKMIVFMAYTYCSQSWECMFKCSCSF